jgi:hypothetical protein
MRAALLPTPGNPQMLAYWLRNFETWREYVDELVVCVNGPTEPEVARLLDKAGAKVIWSPHRLGHDGAIDALLGVTSADLVVLCEDDAYVRKPDMVGLSFDMIEQGLTDIVGSPRHEDYAASPLQVWPQAASWRKEELRRGLWPAFLFIRRDDLLATDRLYGDGRWGIGETVRGWRKVSAEDCEYVGIAPDYIHLDTLIGTTIQLRANGLRTHLIHHVRLFDAAAAEQWIAEDPPWFHVTGLSTLDQLEWPLAMLPDYGPGGGLWTRRLAWWRRVGIDIGPFLERADVSMVDLEAWDERFARWDMAVPYAVH